jgi:hypothetical protein
MISKLIKVFKFPKKFLSPTERIKARLGYGSLIIFQRPIIPLQNGHFVKGQKRGHLR